VIIVLAGLLLGVRGSFIMAAIVSVEAAIIGYADINGLSPFSETSSTGYDDIAIVATLSILTAVILRVIINRLSESTQEALTFAKAQETANTQLKELQGDLERRVELRTTELRTSNQQNERRARQFEAIAQVARATTANESLETLLPRLAVLVSEQFGFYHTGIFLVDDNREYAVLRAANSEGGMRMLERGHKLQVGQTGMVGFVSAIGTPRVAIDVGADAVFFDNPDLPNTRSEMALPLRTAEEIIGVLDVQSTEPNAFQEEDIEVLATLASQVTIAIQNASTYETMQSLLQEAQKASGAYLQDAWKILQSDEKSVGYRVAGKEVSPLTKPLSSSPVKKAMQNKQTVAQTGDTSALVVPIRLRDEVVGVMDIHRNEEQEWDEDEVDIAEAVAERLSLALETSLLLKSTQKRAEIERITADISGKIGAKTQFEAILRTAAEELSRALGGSEVLVQVQSLELPEETGQ
jgi:GAF domain-containing protein